MYVAEQSEVDLDEGPHDCQAKGRVYSDERNVDQLKKINFEKRYERVTTPRSERMDGARC